VYSDPKDVEYKELIKMCWIDSGGQKMEGPCVVNVYANFDRPKTHYKKDGALSAEGQRHALPVMKPDIDNVLKIVMDAITECFTNNDDAHVAVVHAYRNWTFTNEREGLRISVQRLRPLIIHY